MPVVELQTLQKRRLRNQWTATILAGLSPDRSRTSTLRFRWLPRGPRDTSTSSEEVKVPPPNRERSLVEFLIRSSAFTDAIDDRLQSSVAAA